MGRRPRRLHGRSGRPGRGPGRFRVLGGHPDGAGDLLDLGLQPGHVRGDLAEADAGGDGGRGVLDGLQLPTPRRH
jgi:hypothetical protein